MRKVLSLLMVLLSLTGCQAYRSITEGIVYAIYPEYRTQVDKQNAAQQRGEPLCDPKGQCMTVAPTSPPSSR